MSETKAVKQTVKQCSINFAHYIRLVYGTLLIQFLNVCKSVFFLFSILKYTTNYQFLFLDVRQPTIAKLDDFSLLQNIERVSELRFKYMGSCPSDTVAQLTKYSFANIISAPKQ